MIINRIRRQLERLHILPHEALIVGSSVMAVYGLRNAADIDIMVSKSVFDRIAGEGYQVLRYSDGSGRIVIENVELMYTWHEKTIDDFLLHASTIDGIRFISLSDLRSWKLEQNRPKDQRDIKLIDEYLHDQNFHSYQSLVS